MGHYMTKEGTPIRCENCLYWFRKTGYTGRCGNANQKANITNFNKKCGEFWPKQEYRL